jgi:lysophospholipase L1-like esterase
MTAAARRVRLTAVAAALALLPAAGSAGAAQSRPLPTVMVALGDSISRGFDACGFYVDCPERSWSTGVDDRVDSQRARLTAAGAKLAATNLAHTGATVAELADQVAGAVADHADYVTLEIGANDACSTDVASMTPVADYRSRLRAALDKLHDGLPQARMFIASVPDLFRLWQVGHGNKLARFAWSHGHICQSMLAAPESTAAGDVTRREAVRTRVEAYNAELAAACEDYGSACRYDKGAVFDTPFTADQISKWDWFHPNVNGQHELAAVTWRAGFFD